MLLVTGITGHSGKHFLNELIKAQYSGKIRCIVRNTKKIDVLKNTGLDIEVFVCDLNDKSRLEESMSGVDTVLHIASIFYSENIAQAAVKAKINRLILVHTTGIYSKYKSASAEYQDIEDKVNDMLFKSDTKHIYLRPTMIYGYIGDRNMIVFIRMVDKLKVFPVIDSGENLVQPVNGRDLGKAYYQLLIKKEIISGDYILSGERPIKMIDMFRLIAEVLGKRTYFINCPLWMGETMARALRLITFGKIDYLEKIQRMGRSENRSFSHEQASKDFEYMPMSLREGLQIEIKEYLTIKDKGS